MKLLNEDYLDNVPDMSGPSPFKSDGTRKDDWFLIRIPAEKVGQKDRWLRKTIDFWETPRQHYKSSYNYYAIQLEDGEGGSELGIVRWKDVGIWLMSVIFWIGCFWCYYEFKAWMN